MQYVRRSGAHMHGSARHRGIEQARHSRVCVHVQVPFSLMATAYRRKRLMEGIISGDKETMGQIVQLSERQAQVGSGKGACGLTYMVE